jgi:hypothetical protein
MATKKSARKTGAKKSAKKARAATEENGSARKGSWFGSKGGGSSSSKGGPPTPSSQGILAWEDDPISGLPPINRPVPNVGAAPFGTKITDPAPPAKTYSTGTREFRYWTAADALRRASDYWGGLITRGKWQGNRDSLNVFLDEGKDLNAYYDRRALNFFHDTVAGKTVYSGESPDIICHEFGHAILDAVRPQLWNVASVETSAFHESFGDMSAILCALQLPSVQTAVIAETGGRLNRNSRVSRLAEQLGWAIRQIAPQAVDNDSLRNAVNSFFYRDPDTLPPNAPANLLSTEPHSFSRVFTAGFLEAVAGMLFTVSQTPSPADIQKVSRDAGRLLLDAIADAPIVPEYYSQIAAHMVEADTSGKYQKAIKSAFVRRGILSLEAAMVASRPGAAVGARRGIASMVGVETTSDAPAPVPQVPLNASRFGLSEIDSIVVDSPGQTKRIAARSASLTAFGAATPPPSHEAAARAFVEDLFQRGRVAMDETDGGGGGSRRGAAAPGEPLHTFVRKTHELKREGGQVVLVRRTFDCGFDSY